MNAVYDYENKNAMLMDLLKKHNIPLDELEKKASEADDKGAAGGEETEFVKKFNKSLKKH